MAPSRMDRALGLASIGVGLLATVVLAVAVSADYWLYTDEPIDTGMMPHLAPTEENAPGNVDDQADVADEADAMAPSSVVTTVTTNSGLWRICVYAKFDLAGEHYYTDMQSYARI